MKISNKLTHFDEPTLIIISNSMGAVFYYANKDEVNKVMDFHIEKPEFSDREDFGRFSTGVVYETGTKYDKKKLLIIREFKQQFVSALKFLSKRLNIKKMIIFSAKTLYNYAREMVLKVWKGTNIQQHWKGDYTKKHLVEILEVIETNKKSNFQIKAAIS